MLTRFLILFVCLAASAAPLRGFAQSAPGESAPPADQRPSQEETAARRARWEALSDEEKTKLRKRMEQYKQLSGAQRQELRKQAREFEELGQRVYRMVSKETRDKLDQLSPAKRQELLQELSVEEMRDMGRRLMRKLPEEDRRRIQQASPEERARVLDRLRDQFDQRMPQAVLRMAMDLNVPRAEVDRLRALGPDQQRQALLTYVKHRVNQFVQDHGLPVGLEPVHWERLAKLPPSEFYLALVRLRREFPGFAEVAKPHRPTGAGGTRNPGRKDSDGERLRKVLNMPLDMDMRLKLSGVTGKEREKELRRIQRVRVMDLLVKHKYITPAMRAELDQIPERVFAAKVRQFRESGANLSELPVLLKFRQGANTQPKTDRGQGARPEQQSKQNRGRSQNDQLPARQG